MPNLNILKILTLTTAPMFSIFSANWSAKVYVSKAPFKDKNQFNWSWVDWNRLLSYIIPISKGNSKLSSLIWWLGVLMENYKTSN